jgi:hypothetical protein
VDYPAQLTLIGYWAGPEAGDSWPDPQDHVDESWTASEREFVGLYLSRGLVARSYMGYSSCRICGANNGSLELTDGYFVWPVGLSHYVIDHAVRPPAEFVTHVSKMTDAIEGAPRDEDWWRSFGPSV